jgi:hypothetical protein
VLCFDLGEEVGVVVGFGELDGGAGVGHCLGVGGGVGKALYRRLDG